MYIKDQYATLFNSNLKGSDKVTVKNLSMGDKQKDGSYAYESWTGRCVGQAKELVDTLPEKTRLKISGQVHTGYDKESKKSYPYILVTHAEVVESTGASSGTSAGTSNPVIEEDALPF